MPKKSHGLSKHPLYRVWQELNQRCHNPRCRRYKWYGAAGVTVCPEWRTDPVAFVQWGLANGWEPGLEIDKDIKVPGNKVYSPDTCQFVKHRENMMAVVSRGTGRRTAKLKLSTEQVADIVRRKGNGEKSADLAIEFNVAHGYINFLYRENKL